MKRLIYIVPVLVGLALWLALASGVSVAQTVGAPAVDESAVPDVRVLRSDLDGVLLELTAPSPVLGAGRGELSGYETVQVAGFEVMGESGAPQLPEKGVSVGVPAGAEVELRLVEVEQEALPGSHRVAPAPTHGVEAPPPELWQSQVAAGTLERTVSWHEDPAVYGEDAAYPGAPVQLGEVGQVRSQRLAVMGYYPVQANAVTGELLYTSRVVVELVFHYPEGRVGLAGGEEVVESASFERMLAGSLVNYETAREWRVPGGATLPTAAVPAGIAASPDPGYKVIVRETGLYELSYDDLALAGLPVDELDPATLQMFYHDQELAIYVADEGDVGSFDAGDYVLFYGEALSGKYLKYTDDNVYWLSYGQAEGRRMAEADGTPAEGAVPETFQDVAHFEEDRHYWSYMPGEGDDYSRWWYGGNAAPGSIPMTAALTDVMTSTLANPLTASIEVVMVGYTDLSADEDQHVRVWVNENQVGEFEWDGIAWATAEFAFDQGYLKAGTDTNDIRFELVQNPGVGAWASVALLDWYEIGYERSYHAVGDLLDYGSDVDGNVVVDGFTAMPEEGVADLTTFDVTDPLTVTRVLSTVWEADGLGTYQVQFGDTVVGAQAYWTGLPGARLSPVSIEMDSPSDLRLTATGVDYIMITHRDFYTEILTLTNYYNGTGVETVLVDVQDVYDEFSGGVFYPGAIRDFLSYAYHNSGGDPPDYVLLVGDGHWDFKGLDPDTDQEQYLPPYLAYVDPVLGETAADNRYVCVAGDDILPDMALGRFPVNTAEEAAAMVNKSITYQTAPSADWNANLLFVADDPDGGGDFYQLSDDIIAGWVPETYTATQVYYGTEGYLTAADTKTAILDAISEGQLFVSYIGHAAIPWWGEEKFLRTTDVMTNTALPIMLPMTCQEGFYIDPSSQTLSLSEVLVRMEDGGAVASFAPTGWGVAAGHDYLQKGFFDAVFNEGVVRLGDATDAAKLYLYNNAPSGAYRDLIDTYVLLGDPALKISLSANPTGVSLDYFTAQVEPTGSVVLRWETLTEVDTLGFNLYRAPAGGRERIQLNPVLIPSATPFGSSSGAAYEYTDAEVEAGITYDYWLEEVDIYGEGSLFGPVRVSVPAVFHPEYRLFLPLIQRQRG